jgi:hypothetical protein
MMAIKDDNTQRERRIQRATANPPMSPPSAKPTLLMAGATIVQAASSSTWWRTRRGCHGLSMLHSPRLHGNTLWVLNSDTGEIGTVDLKKGGSNR